MCQDEPCCPRGWNMNASPAPDTGDPPKRLPDGAPGRVRLHRLLVPMDFSASSLRAYHYAVALAECFGGKIALLHVVPPSMLTGASRTGFTCTMRLARVPTFISQPVPQ